jgi:hypothetical protein
MSGAVFAAVPVAVQGRVAEPEIRRHVDDLESFGQLCNDILGGAMGQTADHRVAVVPEGVPDLHQWRRGDEAKMGKDFAERLPRMGVGRQRGQFDMGMTGGEPDGVRPRVPRGADHADADFLLLRHYVASSFPDRCQQTKKGAQAPPFPCNTPGAL